jgi:hypothetical protein
LVHLRRASLVYDARSFKSNADFPDFFPGAAEDNFVVVLRASNRNVVSQGWRPGTNKAMTHAEQIRG